ncbi:MAG: DUF504 domain-containing protein [Thioalkalispiraceae bacterium]|jgi:uncharacterized protein (UPF0248 family)
MQPIHELINRIHWDREFGEGDFELGFLDRLQDKIIRLPFSKVVFSPGDHYFFHYMDEDGNQHNVPYHRIKTVYKNGNVIWHRTH